MVTQSTERRGRGRPSQLDQLDGPKFRRIKLALADGVTQRDASRHFGVDIRNVSRIAKAASLDELRRALGEALKENVGGITQVSGLGLVTAGDALSKTGNTLDWVPDGTTLEVAADQARVKDGGISTAKLANGAVDKQKASVNAPATSLSASTPNAISSTGANTLAASDHTHAIITGAPTQSIKSDAATPATGFNAAMVRTDAQWVAQTAAASDIGTANTQGSSQSLARADHGHKIGAGAINASGMFAAGVVDGAALADGSVDENKLATGAVDSAHLGPALAVDTGVVGVPSVFRVPFAAGGGGAPDDVTILAAAGFAFYVLDAQVLISTAVGGATAQLRDAAAGAGNALSDAFDAASTGRKRDTGAGTSNATPIVAQGSPLVLRRSDNGIAGEAIVTIVRES